MPRSREPSLLQAEYEEPNLEELASLTLKDNANHLYFKDSPF